MVIRLSQGVPATEMSVSLKPPYGSISKTGMGRAEEYLLDRVEQLLENELQINTVSRQPQTGKRGVSFEEDH